MQRTANLKEASEAAAQHEASKPIMGTRRRCLGFAVFVGVTLCGCAVRHNGASASGSQAAFAEKIQIAGVSDAGKVNDYLYRGTQPYDEGLESLKRLGIDTIVDLRGEMRGTEEKETRNAAILGIRVVNIAGDGWSPPTDAQMAQFFSLFREKPRHKIYIHCWLGSDRSGVFIAAYRIAFDGWTAERALAEMYYFHFKGFWHPAMKSYIQNFPERLAQSAALAPFREPQRPIRRADLGNARAELRRSIYATMWTSNEYVWNCRRVADLACRCSATE
jgi:hypothetical protein